MLQTYYLFPSYQARNLAYC